MPILKQDGFDFCFDPSACRTCSGNCCRGRPGNIWVNRCEIYKISHYLKINTIDFIRHYLHLVNNRHSLVEVPNDGGYDCIFYDTENGGCSIYPVRPIQCRQFPFWQIYRTDWQDLLAECPGIVGAKA
jgi:Fe-S-cluster containining protein